MAVPEKYREILGYICAAVEDESVAAFEVREKSTGRPAILLVAVREEDDGNYGVVPLARLDLDFEDLFDPGIDSVDPGLEFPEGEVCESSAASDAPRKPQGPPNQIIPEGVQPPPLDATQYTVGVYLPGGEPVNLARFISHDAASEYIGTILAEKDPEGVERGHYYLDGPNED